MNRRQLLRQLLGLATTSASLLLYGCRPPKPPEPEKCEHEWEKAASGEIRCKKCGVYKKD